VLGSITDEAFKLARPHAVQLRDTCQAHAFQCIANLLIEVACGTGQRPIVMKANKTVQRSLCRFINECAYTVDLSGLVRVFAVIPTVAT
jgi:hypothetical protein